LKAVLRHFRIKHKVISSQVKEQDMTADTIEEAAPHLPEQQRAQQAHKLLLSLDPQSETDIAEEWRGEAQRRATDLDNGTATPILAEVVRAAAQALLKLTSRCSMPQP
jgi:hypothetical protein